MKPLVILNFKAFAESTFPQSASLVKAVLEAREKNYEVICCPQSTELLFLKKSFGKADFFAQNISPNSFGSFTGSIGLSQLKKIGVNGSLVNHSEKKKKSHELEEIILEANEAGFRLVVCVDSLAEARRIASLKPWAVAFEPPELIGSGKSVSSERPEIVEQFVKLVSFISPKTIPLVGAGVSNNADLKKSLELGAKGVLLASAFVKSKNPKAWLKEFLA